MGQYYWVGHKPGSHQPSSKHEFIAYTKYNLCKFLITSSNYVE